MMPTNTCVCLHLLIHWAAVLHTGCTNMDKLRQACYSHPLSLSLSLALFPQISPWHSVGTGKRRESGTEQLHYCPQAMTCSKAGLTSNAMAFSRAPNSLHGRCFLQMLLFFTNIISVLCHSCLCNSPGPLHCCNKAATQV